MACLGLSGCGDSGTHTRLVFALQPSLISKSSVQASGVRALTSEPSLPDIVSSDGLSFRLDQADASLVDIRLTLGTDRTCADVKDSLASGVGCEDAADSGRSVLTFAGPVLFDLVNGTVLSGGELEIPPGLYEGIGFRFDPIVSGGDGFRARTRIFKDGQEWSMDLTVPPGETLGFASTNPRLPVKEGGSLRVTFRQDTWIQDLPLASCFQKGDLTLTDSVLSLDAARGECQGAGDRMRTSLRAHGGMSAHSF
ncbi:hypothetical protein [Corallococcus llansteffanensis]|uniref:Uncharacterized protein n=1 Tax=Corallococcus llansteffanensis TaxID=2316731 RepID=A0A3A8PBL1_9BACT|nr:hypothetical protein [Corallococcus llansteffanensis]RKH49084.1 hypothetical protein D7V93_32400 [Corallococcus llansteffanensis]